MQRAMVLAAFGHTVDDKQLKTDAFERNGVPTFRMKLTKQKEAFKVMISGKKSLLNAIKKFEDLDLLKDTFDESKQMFEVLDKNLYIMAEVWLLLQNRQIILILIFILLFI